MPSTWVNLIKLLQVWLLFSYSKTIATLLNYTCKIFIKLTAGYRTAILHSHSLVYRGMGRGKKKSVRGRGVEMFIGIPRGSLCGEEKHDHLSHAKV